MLNSETYKMQRNNCVLNHNDQKIQGDGIGGLDPVASILLIRFFPLYFFFGCSLLSPDLSCYCTCDSA